MWSTTYYRLVVGVLLMFNFSVTLRKIEWILSWTLFEVLANYLCYVYKKNAIYSKWINFEVHVSDDWEIKFLKVIPNTFSFVEHKLMMLGDAQIQNC